MRHQGPRTSPANGAARRGQRPVARAALGPTAAPAPVSARAERPRPSPDGAPAPLSLLPPAGPTASPWGLLPPPGGKLFVMDAPCPRRSPAPRPAPRGCSGHAGPGRPSPKTVLSGGLAHAGGAAVALRPPPGVPRHGRKQPSREFSKTLRPCPDVSGSFTR